MGFIKAKPVIQHLVALLQVPMHKVEWSKLVSLDFETFYDEDYTLSKLSTSEYIRDPRFEALMVGVKIGRRKTVVVPGPKIKAYLAKIDWKSHSLLCHNTQFDGFILSHHYKVVPKFYYCTMSMGRGLHSNEIGAGLDEVAKFYGREGKLVGGVEGMKGLRYKDLVRLKKYDDGARYCGRDVDEMYGIFEQMVAKMPDDEIGLIDLTVRMFCDPVLRVNIPRVEAELAREIAERERLFMNVVPHDLYEKPGQEKELKTLLKTGAERELQGKARIMLKARRILGSNEKFADLLRAEGVEPPVKISPAWIKKPVAERKDEDKWAYAFAKDDADFVNMPDDVDALSAGLDLNKKADVKVLVARQERLRLLVDCRLAVKSTTNITRAQRFLTAGANGMRLPAGYAYARAHTLRWGGINKMNLQNLTRGGELRQAIEAETPKHELCVSDSGQIEARVNGWLWGQDDLLESFVAADRWDDAVMGMARGKDRDAYCKFGDSIYGFEVTKANKTERFVGKVCLGPETVVLTSQGPKQIIDVRVTDLLWDGEAWVNHEGLVDQGERTVLSSLGMSATPDHEILTAHGWVEWQEALTDPSLIQSALSSANLPSSGGTTTSLGMGSLGATGPFANARAVPRTWSTPAALNQVARHVATRAQRLLRAQSDTGSIGKLCRMTNIAHACLTDLRLLSAAVVTRATPLISTTGSAAFQCVLPGPLIAQSSYGTFKLSQDGISLNLNSTGSIRTAITSQGMFGSSPSQATSRTSGKSRSSNSESVISKRLSQTYDLANAGPNRRFTVMSSAGPVIVHNCVLGLGFQMGAPKLQVTLAKGALGGPPVFFTLDECKKIVNTYRLKNYKIVAGWKICERIIEDMAAGRAGSHKCISWDKETIYLPNGLTLKYPQLKKTRNEEKGWEEWSYMSGEIRKKLYGGLLCENIVQCLARIIVGWQMLQISKKYRVVMTTHDEVVTNVLATRAAAALKFMLKWMRTPPEWCADIPLNAEGGHAPNYSK